MTQSALTIWHNPRCSKSRQTLALIEAAGMSPQISLYLETPPSEADIRKALKQLGFDDARTLMRTGESIYKELGLKNEMDQDTLIQAMASHPKLIERPFVSDGQKAVLGRPPENVNKLL